MKTYKFEVIIKEGSDEFWEDITKDGNSGCDDVLKEVRTELSLWDAEVTLIQYTEK